MERGGPGQWGDLRQWAISVIGVELPRLQRAVRGAGPWRVRSLGTSEETLEPQPCALGLRPVLPTWLMGTSLTICPREGGGLMTWD